MSATTITPPAGFTATDTAGDPVLEVLWDGPAHVAETWKVTSQWSPVEGVTFFIDHNGDDPWTSAEVGALPAALAEVQQVIGNAAALEYLRQNAPINLSKMTVDDVFGHSVQAGLPASAMFHAWVILRDEEAVGK